MLNPKCVVNLACKVIGSYWDFWDNAPNTDKRIVHVATLVAAILYRCRIGEYVLNTFGMNLRGVMIMYEMTALMTMLMHIFISMVMGFNMKREQKSEELVRLFQVQKDIASLQGDVFRLQVSIESIGRDVDVIKQAAAGQTINV